MVRTLGLAILVLAGMTLAAGAAPGAGDVVLRSFDAGTGDRAVGIAVSQGGEDREDDGPQALASDERGRLFLLDQVNGRILSFDPASPAAAPQALALPADVLPTDLVVRQDNLYVWDGRIHALTPVGAADAPTRGLAETRSGEPVDEATRTAFAQAGSDPDGRDDDGAAADGSRGVGQAPAARTGPALSRQTVDTSGRGVVVADVAITDRGAGALLHLKAKDQAPVAATLAMRVAGRLGTVAFLNIDKAGRLFVLAENVPENMHDSAFAFVARYAPKGTLEGIYELPLAQTTSVSRRVVAVSPEGDVYFLKTSRKGVDVVGLGFRAAPPNTRTITAARVLPNAASLAWTDTPWVGLAVGPLTRQRVLQTALGFEGVTWTVAPTNYGPEADRLCTGFAGRIRRPMYMIGKQNQQVRGVPYCWGCQGSLSQFVSHIQRGALAGNVCTRDGPRPDVVGVDCSSFVCAAWGLSTHFDTAAIPAIAHQLSNPWDLQPGDALDKPGSHVVLFLGFTPDRQARVMEASPGACQGRVCRNTYPLSSLLARGFIPVRYRALVDAAPPAAAQAGRTSAAQ